MIKNLIKDESGLSTIEILVGMIVLVLLAIISFAALRGGIHNASDSLGKQTNKFVTNAKATGAGANQGSYTVNWGK